MTAKNTVEQSVLGLLADALEYPIENPVGPTMQCAELLASEYPTASAELREFVEEISGIPLGRLQEIFTGTFDLDASRHPYVGYHLFGESYMRSAFLTELKERYRVFGYESSETELPDRLSTVLGFLSVCDDEETRQEFIDEALLPVMSKIMKDAPEVGEDVSKDGHLFPVLSNSGGASDDPDSELEKEMVEAGFFPTLGDSPDEDESVPDAGLPEGVDPYRHLLQGLRLVLQQLGVGEQQTSTA